jgi:hypothetical protein
VFDPENMDYRVSFQKKTTAVSNGAAFQQSLMDKETSLFCPCIRVRRGFKLKVVTALLVLAVFLERYTFIVSVYKTKFFGYLLILFVIFLNVMIQAIQSSIRKDKHKRMLHQMFEIERTPKIGLCVITILG